MKYFLYRFLAYIITGAIFGTAARLLVFDTFHTETFPMFAVIASLVAAGVGLCVWLLKKASVCQPSGIRISPLWTVAAMDVVCIIAATMAIFFIIDGYADKYLGLTRGITDPLVADVIAFMFLPSALVLALLVTSAGGQNITINEAGIKVTGPFGTQMVVWNEIERLRPDEQYVAVSRLGVPMPRHLRTNLEIVCGSGTITVYQPALKGISRQVLGRLRENAPRPLLKDLDGIEAAWL